MYEYGDTDEYDFTPTETSKLAALFGASMPEMQSSTDTNSSSLMYTAPKQPSLPKNTKQQKNTTVNKPSTEVLIVKVVALWKMERTKFISLGKHGLGLIGSPDSKAYELIVYKTKDNILLRVKITNSFVFSVQKDNFSSFCDDESQNWLVKFDNNDQKEFVEKLKLYDATVIDSKTNTELKKSESIGDTLKTNLSRQEKLGTGDQDSDSSEKRANILSRITKLGQQVVPNPVSNSSDLSDSEDQVRDNRKPRKLKKSIPEKPLREPLPTPSLQKAVVTKPVHEMSMGTSQYSVFVPQNDALQSYLLNQNNELKLTLSTIHAKLDALNIPKVCNDNSSLTSKVKALELKAENLEAIVDNYKKNYAELEARYIKVLNKDKSKLVESSFVVSNLEAEVSTLKLDLEVANDQLTTLEKQKEELHKSKQIIKSFETTIEAQNSKIKDLEKYYDENKELVKRNENLMSLSVMVEDLNQRLKSYEDKFTRSELEREHLKEKHSRKINNMSDLMKLYMNEMYQNILSNFNEEYSYNYDEIKATLAENLKETTYKMIAEISEKIVEDNDHNDQA